MPPILLLFASLLVGLAGLLLRLLSLLAQELLHLLSCFAQDLGTRRTERRGARVGGPRRGRRLHAARDAVRRAQWRPSDPPGCGRWPRAPQRGAFPDGVP